MRMSSFKMLAMPIPAPCAMILAAAFITFAPLGALAAEDSVIARVDGHEITEGEYELLKSDLQSQLSRIPAEQHKKLLTEALIDLYLISKAAEAEGLHESDSFKRRFGFLRQQILRNEYFKAAIESKITDDDIRKTYDQSVAGFKPETEIHARHILVKTEDEAKAIIKELDGGKDFAELAKEKSTGPSGPNGGDLGFFGKGRMVPEFETAAFALEPGKHTSEPVKTQFGFHVIKVEETRDTEPPAFDQLKSRIRQSMTQQRIGAEMAKLREGASIEITAAKKEAGGEVKKDTDKGEGAEKKAE